MSLRPAWALLSSDNRILYQKNQRRLAGEMTEQLSVLFVHSGTPRVRIYTTHTTSPVNSVCNSSSEGSHAVFWPTRLQTRVYTHSHAQISFYF